MILASSIFLKEKLSKIKIACVVLALLGMVLVSGVLKMTNTSPTNLKGVLFSVIAAVLYACVIILNKCIKDISAYDMTIVQLGLAAILLFPYSLLQGDFSKSTFSSFAILLLLFLGLIHTGLCYSIYFNCTKYLKTQTIAIYSYMDPIVAVILSTLFLGEKMTFSTLLGAALILGSTLISEFSET